MGVKVSRRRFEPLQVTSPPELFDLRKMVIVHGRSTKWSALASDLKMVRRYGAVTAVVGGLSGVTIGEHGGARGSRRVKCTVTAVAECHRPSPRNAFHESPVAMMVVEYGRKWRRRGGKCRTGTTASTEEFA